MKCEDYAIIPVFVGRSAGLQYGDFFIKLIRLFYAVRDNYKIWMSIGVEDCHIKVCGVLHFHFLQRMNRSMIGKENVW
ncbi:hypothetical protein A7K95_05415 [Pediococcus parvulus]|uniref:Transposase n=1 Tax=Pediococcus parvulus TaxID=54062 RepID=A0ABX2UGH0_9LACO|nr:hypothetical protein A7K95_05415 [Pediococcus parvulus]